VSSPVQVRTILMRTSQLWRGAGLLPALAATKLEQHNSPSTMSPQGRSFAWRGEDDRELTARFPHSLLLQPEPWQATASGSTAVRLHRCPERHRVLQTGVSIKRHLSCIFPAHPRSLASALVPRPSARRCSASATPPCGSGFPKKKSPCGCGPLSGARFLSSEPPQKAHLGTWERGTSRRFAQGCPEGNPGKYKQGETPWHSTKTKSL
jgi:hypothetical protein